MTCKAALEDGQEAGQVKGAAWEVGQMSGHIGRTAWEVGREDD